MESMSMHGNHIKSTCAPNNEIHYYSPKLERNTLSLLLEIKFENK